jgi:exodeoxyribonuclease-1
MHPIYAGWYYAFDLRIDIEPLLNLSINELKVEMKKSPKFLRTIRSNKAPIIVDAKYGMQVEPYNVMDKSLINKRADIIRNNEKFSQNILHALREVAEEKEQSKTQEDIYAEESIYTKFTSNKDTALFPAWHAASWKDKLKLLDKFDDDRLVGFGKKIIYQESPDTLPKDIFNSVKRGIAKRILSEKKERWWTVNMCFSEIDTLRDQYDNENDAETLKTLETINSYVMSVQQKYENA